MDIRQEITNQIINLIEQGQLKGESLWDGAIQLGLPKNHQSRKNYSGVNVLILSSAAADRGFTSNEWLTFKQAQSMGAQVRKGAKGVMGVFFKMLDPKESKAQSAGQLSAQDEAYKVPMLSPFWVFNIADIDNLPANIEETGERAAFDPVVEAERMLSSTGARITWQGARAFYRPASDEIFMPERSRFTNASNAYAVALHEVTHWTGHESRLNRNFSQRTDAYAFEELVAELGAAYLVAHLGLKGAKLENHASYLGHYLQIMKADKGAIFTAARLASQAFDYILKLTNEDQIKGEIKGESNIESQDKLIQMAEPLAA